MATDRPMGSAATRYPWRVRCSGCGWVDHFDTEATAQSWADQHNAKATSWPHDAKVGPVTDQPDTAAPWPGLEGCVCPRVWKSPGVLYGIRMMACWVRLTDEPDCPIHAPHVIARDGSCVKRGHHHR